MKAWYRGRLGFVLAFTLIAVLVISTLAGISFYNQERLAHLASFTCSLCLSDQTFTIEMDVNLVDGMNRDEALEVAMYVFDAVLGDQGALYELTSADTYENGTWRITFAWGYHFEELKNQFDFVIDPLKQVVIYDPHLTVFTCRREFTNETFPAAVDVTLIDGMDMYEAIDVAAKVFEISVGAKYVLHSVHGSVFLRGVWIVSFDWDYEKYPPQPSVHFFEAFINVYNRTVTFNYY